MMLRNISIGLRVSGYLVGNSEFMIHRRKKFMTPALRQKNKFCSYLGMDHQKAPPSSHSHKIANTSSLKRLLIGAPSAHLPLYAAVYPLPMQHFRTDSGKFHLS